MTKHLLGAALVLGLLPTAVSGQRGTIRGIVHFDGRPPAVERLKVTKDQDVCGASVPSRHLLVRDGRIGNAVLFLDGTLTVPARPAPVRVANVSCDFDPTVQVAEAGALLTLRNEDPMMHNVHLVHAQGGVSRTVGNIALPVRGLELQNRRALQRPGLVEVKCDAHEWMKAKIWVFDHPYHAVSGADGAFEIRDVPPGRYVVRAWHEVLGEASRDVAVQPGKSTVVEFRFGR